MKKGKTGKINYPDSLDQEMMNYSLSKNKNIEEINELEQTRKFISDHMKELEYSFNPFFIEILINKITNKSPVNDISFDLSFLLRRVMIFTVFTIVFLLSYLYITYGSMSELLVINTELLNDTKLISSILNEL
jgi:hypothetical protein